MKKTQAIKLVFFLLKKKGECNGKGLFIKEKGVYSRLSRESGRTGATEKKERKEGKETSKAKKKREDRQFL
ncbi:hypothetical protein JNUCC77_18395 (plasmid) [Enterococcus alishanensis]